MDVTILRVGNYEIVIHMYLLNLNHCILKYFSQKIKLDIPFTLFFIFVLSLLRQETSPKSEMEVPI